MAAKHSLETEKEDKTNWEMKIESYRKEKDKEAKLWEKYKKP